MLPQGLLVIAAHLPDTWHVRFIDENIAPATPQDFERADAVFASGMHIQAAQIWHVVRRAKTVGKVVVLGGPSPSVASEMYPEADYLHIGGVGDATDAWSVAWTAISRRPQTRSVSKPRSVCRSATFPLRLTGSCRSAAI